MHTVVINENKDVLIFGANHHGQLGLAYTCYQKFVLIEIFKKISIKNWLKKTLVILLNYQ